MLRFGPPIMWLSFLTIPLLIALYWYAHKSRQKVLGQFGDSTLVSHLTDSLDPARRRIKRWLIVTGFLFLSVGLIAPKIGTSLTEVKREGINLMLLLDTSLSMNTEDITPSRVERAKYEASQLVEKLRGDRVGLIAFAGVSYLHSPLTLDYSAAKMFLDVMDTDLIPSQGTAIGDAITTALESFDTEESRYRAIVMFTDGEDQLGKAMDAANEAADMGVPIYTVGVGTPAGGPIPVEENGNSTYKRDRQGKVVTSRLDSGILQEIATITGGTYYQIDQPGYSSAQLYEDIFQLERTELSSHEYTSYEERYQYFLAVAILLFVTEMFVPERKRKHKPKKTT